LVRQLSSQVKNSFKTFKQAKLQTTDYFEDSTGCFSLCLEKHFSLFKTDWASFVQGSRNDLYKDSKHPRLNPNQKQHNFKLHHGFEISKLPCSTISPYLMETNLWDAFRNVLV